MLKSMTGFGRAEGLAHGTSWSWEMRAVNGKNLDIRMRLPPGYERMEQAARKLIAHKLARGNVQVALVMTRGAGGAQPVVNQDVLDGVLAAIEKIESLSERSPSSAADILAIRGVLDSGDSNLNVSQQKELEEAMLDSLHEAVAALNQNRTGEGDALANILNGLIGSIEKLTAAAEADPARSNAAISQRLQEQLARLEGISGEWDPQRVQQEVALLATKADIREELDRLGAHTQSARELIEKGSPVGRKLEFLSQEFNRECNTLCSKSNAVSLTNTGLELKVVIDQFREQCLNVE